MTTYNPADYPDGKGPRPPADGPALEIIDRQDRARIQEAIDRATLLFRRSEQIPERGLRR